MLNTFSNGISPVNQAQGRQALIINRREILIQIAEIKDAIRKNPGDEGLQEALSQRIGSLRK